MTRVSASLAAILSVTAICACAVIAQAPQAPAAPGQQQRGGPRPAPTNLKVLPKTTSGDEVRKIMQTYTGDLGVECEFCHAQNPETKRNDFASDANPTKDRARYMIQMTAELNDKWLAEMPDRTYADPITCGTCHRGAKHPSVFTPAPRTPPARPATPPAAPTN